MVPGLRQSCGVADPCLLEDVASARRSRRRRRGGESLWKVPQKITAKILVILVRVKTCGKSARSASAMDLRGKPYQEQGKTVCPVVRSDLNTRVCRIDKWLSLHAVIRMRNRIRLTATAYSPIYTTRYKKSQIA